MTPACLVFDLFDTGGLADRIAQHARAERGTVVVRRFPDEESYVRYDCELAGRVVVLVCNLSRPDARLPALFFAAATARELGASRIVLAAPYLPYMRQDHRFRAGEAVTSRIFARFVCGHFDRLLTVDPHLHRYAALDELYSIPATRITAAPAIAQWIAAHVERPVLIGPDGESRQWVAAIAQPAGIPWTVARKTRRGDRDVTVEVPDLGAWRGRTPVLVDDIISSGHTMMEAVRCVRSAQFPAPLCIGVHAVFADDAYAALQASGAARIVTTDTLPHPSNAIAIGPLLAHALSEIDS